jgi:predicted ribonuclease toxin of YeeF-YezG toxin-antitoxin module
VFLVKGKIEDKLEKRKEQREQLKELLPEFSNKRKQDFNTKQDKTPRYSVNNNVSGKYKTLDCISFKVFKPDSEAAAFL